MEHLIQYGCTDITTGPTGFGFDSYNGDPIPVPTTGPDERTGYGRINTGNSMALIDPPNYVVHFRNSPTVTLTPTITTNISVQITDYFEDENNITRPPGNYVVDQYKYTATVTHTNLGANAVLVTTPLPANSNYNPYWVRNSISDLWGPNDNGKVNPESDVRINSCTITSATLEGYRYKLKQHDGHNIPGTPFASKMGAVPKLAYSILANAPNQTIKVAETESNVKMNMLQVVPNPATNECNIYFNSDMEQHYEIELLSIEGRVVYKTGGTAQRGINKINVNLSEFSMGMYLVRLKENNIVCQTEKIIKK